MSDQPENIEDTEQDGPDGVSDELLNRVAELRGIQGMTNKKMAGICRVGERQIRKAVAVLKQEGQLLKKELPTNPALRSEILDRHLITEEVAHRNIRKTEEMLELLEQAITHFAKCPHCGREFPVIKLQKSAFNDVPYIDAQTWQALFKGRDTLTRHLEYLSKLKGELSDTPQINIMTIDADLQNIMGIVAELGDYGEELAQEFQREYNDLFLILGIEKRDKFLNRLSGLGRKLARRLFNLSVAEDVRRMKRIGEFDEVIQNPNMIEGDYRDTTALSLPSPRIVEPVDDDEGEDDGAND